MAYQPNLNFCNTQQIWIDGCSVIAGTLITGAVVVLAGNSIFYLHKEYYPACLYSNPSIFTSSLHFACNTCFTNKCYDFALFIPMSLKFRLIEVATESFI